ncbi:DJ-1/PfpI family protein [Paenibacillus antri]|uniref:DJ-1/PfpI family protein n=1 Tax=Paenibacillus antri TaxID=2582848 RepID=A0A5R9GH70_9BACL|nr:DJ-1/PfpI family protein [Paenibacillus antri]TLS52758.1 DJ-1/PfpI family protein [Paenibacillus antri]
MKKNILRFIVYLSIFVLLVGGIGTIGANRSRADWLSVRDAPTPALEEVKIPTYDPDKPTVAVLLGNPLTEVFDFMVPYEMFAMTELYNVFAVAPDNNVKSLTGGLEIVPHYSFEEMDDLLGRSPDLIVVPYMPMSNQEKYRPVREWLQRHAKTNIVSICSGSRNLADAGLLHGKTSTAHWRMFGHSESTYPETNWVRDQRFVQDGNIVSSAGLTSGIDAVLYVISKQFGETAAENVAREMNYPSYHFVKNPTVKPYYIDLTEGIYYLNLAFQVSKEKIGVLLYDGMEEGALASVFDTFSPLGTAKVITISDSTRPIRTKYKLNLIARHQSFDAPSIDQLFVTGKQAPTISNKDITRWKEMNNAAEPEFIHSEIPDRFVFDSTLEELARQEGYLTARWVAKRLEYRADHLKLEGTPLAAEPFLYLMFLGTIALLLAMFIDRRFIIKKGKVIT